MRAVNKSFRKMAKEMNVKVNLKGFSSTLWIEWGGWIKKCKEKY